MFAVCANIYRVIANGKFGDLHDLFDSCVFVSNGKAFNTLRGKEGQGNRITGGHEVRLAYIQSVICVG